MINLTETSFTNLNNTEIKIISCNYNLDLYSDSLFTEYNVNLPKSVSESCAKRKAEYLAGRVCAKHALNYFSFKNWELNSHPQFRYPLWPDNINGSITHTKQYAAAAVTNNKNLLIGIDSEKILNRDNLTKLGNIIINSNEFNNISKNNNFSENIIYTLSFSAKESLFKCIFKLVNKYLDFHDSEILEVNSCNQSFKIILKNIPHLNNEFIGYYNLQEDRINTIITHLNN
ncbi:4'-phosphopantetheinyl transferase family protein [Spirobacillus cienkowskii]|uniref:4'-phosphopantetheinyl transferase family protein n=1 Tax=Spirobacillus cienkowskii TaxID=495820 RepID=UPI0030D0E62A